MQDGGSAALQTRSVGVGPPRTSARFPYPVIGTPSRTAGRVRAPSSLLPTVPARRTLISLSQAYGGPQFMRTALLRLTPGGGLTSICVTLRLRSTRCASSWRSARFVDRTTSLRFIDSTCKREHEHTRNTNRSQAIFINPMPLGRRRPNIPPGNSRYQGGHQTSMRRAPGARRPTRRSALIIDRDAAPS